MSTSRTGSDPKWGGQEMESRRRVLGWLAIAALAAGAVPLRPARLAASEGSRRPANGEPPPTEWECNEMQIGGETRYCVISREHRQIANGQYVTRPTIEECFPIEAEDRCHWLARQRAAQEQ